MNKSVTLPLGFTYTAIISPAGVVYNSVNNPIIGSLQTSTSIGVSEENNFIPILSVFETAPTKSELDVFYETSSSGTVASLNALITQGGISGVSLASISPILSSTILFNESKLGSYLVTQAFSPLDFNNDPINDQGSFGQIVSVLDDNQTPRNNEFKITGPNSSDGTFTISTNNAADAGYYRGASPNPTTFNITAKIVSQGASVFKTFQLELGNSIPTYGRRIYPPLSGTNYTGDYNGTATGDSLSLSRVPAYPTRAMLFGPFGMKYSPVGGSINISSVDPDYGIKTTAPFVAFNGSADFRPLTSAAYPYLQDSLATKELSWEIVSWVIGPNTFGRDFNNLPNEKVRIFNQDTQDFEFVDVSKIDGTFPIAILPAGTIRDSSVEDWQVIIGEDVLQTLNPLRFGGITANNIFSYQGGGQIANLNNFGQFGTPGGVTSGYQPPIQQEVSGNRCQIFIRPLTGAAPNTLSYDSDGDPNGLQTFVQGIISTFSNNNNVFNAAPFPVGSLPVAALINQIEYKITIQAKDGGNFTGEQSTITIIQSGQQ